MDLTLLQDFIQETAEHLEEMESNLLQLESHPDSRDILDNIFRSAHTIKGSSEYLGMKAIASLSHKLESLLEMLRSGDRTVSNEIIDLLMEARDRIASLIAELQRGDAESTGVDDLLERIERFSGRIENGSPGETGIIELDEEPDLELDEEPDLLLFDDDPADFEGAGRESDELHIPDDVDIGDVQQLYNDLKVALYDITRGDVSDGRKRRVVTLLDGLEGVASALDMDGIGEKLAGLKQMADTIVYPDDAGDILATLHTLIDGFLEPDTGVSGSGEPESLEISEKASSAEGKIPGRDADSDDAGDDGFYEEDHDEELFQIFIDHLSDNFVQLHELLNEFPTGGDDGAVFEKLLGIIDGLHASASYMDYRKLARIYDQWREATLKFREQGASGELVSPALISEYMEQVADLFPRFRDRLVPKPLVDSNDDMPLADDSIDDDLAAAEETISESLDDFFADEDTPAPAMDSQGLFDELDNVFEAAPKEHEPSVDIDPFDEDIDDELSGTVQSTRTQLPEQPEEEQRFESRNLVDDGEAANDSGAVEITVADDFADVSEVASDESVGHVEAVESPVAEESVPPADAAALTAAVSEPADGAPDAEPAESPEPAKAKSGLLQYESFGEKVVKQSLRVDARKIDSLMNLVGELVVSRASYSQLFFEMREFEQILRKIPNINPRDLKMVRNLTFRLSEATTSLGQVANDLQEGVMKVRMLPIAQLFNRYPRLVRDLVHDTGKQVRLEIRGEETELDKMVIEEIADPLIHIIRNAVDHGIETESERLKKGKSAEGHLILESYYESNHVVVEISDDGKGIDPERIRIVALEKNLFSKEELDRMTLKELTGIIMRPGFSTADKVTTTSGRGVGMDVVKKNIEKLNGTIEVDSQANAGTRVRIKIPLTLAIIQALLVRVGRDTFTIPLASVEETLRIAESDISMIEGVEVIHLRDSTLTLLRLTDIFGIRSQAPDPGKAFVVIVNTGMKQVGLVVDELIGQEEAVIKPLVDYLQENSGFSGATILGDGRISLILDVYELVNLSITRRVREKDNHGFWWSGSDTPGIDSAVFSGSETVH